MVRVEGLLGASGGPGFHEYFTTVSSEHHVSSNICGTVAQSCRKFEKSSDKTLNLKNQHKKGVQRKRKSFFLQMSKNAPKCNKDVQKYVKSCKKNCAKQQY